MTEPIGPTFYQHAPAWVRVCKSIAHAQQTALWVWGCACPLCRVASDEVDTCETRKSRRERGRG